MHRMRRLGVALCALLLTGCGASGGAEKAAQAKPSAAPTSVESAECRSAVEGFDQLATKMTTEAVSEPDQFFQLFDRAQAIQKQADGASCSSAVMDPLNLAVYRFALANAGYQACGLTNNSIGTCPRDRIARDIAAAGEQTRKAVAAAKLTTN